MRKKSHIALAVYLASELQCERLSRHRKAFCLGSILPDLNPQMVTEPHEFDTSWPKIQQLIRRLEANGRRGGDPERILWRQAGVVMHYLADYFTYPHNACFPGSLKDHCMYERDLKYFLRAFLRRRRSRELFDAQRGPAGKIKDADALLAYIRDAHVRYVQEEHSVPGDCLWIVEVCSRSMLALVSFLCAGEAESSGHQDQVA